MKQKMKTQKQTSKLLTRTNGLWLCIIGIAISLLTGYLEFLHINADFGGMFGIAIFTLGLILIITRWKHDSQDKNKYKDKILTRKLGIWVAAIGLAIFLATPLALYLWDMDIDILGFFLFILGLLIIIVRWKVR
jgi:multisubunit Na+/H+ antiporter MnhB subunit